MAKVETFEVSNSISIDASASTTTDALFTSVMNGYSITLVKSGTDGNPIVEIQGSNDGVNWSNPYFEDDGITALAPELDNDVNSIRDNALWTFSHISIKTIPNGTTTGTLKYTIHWI